MAAVPHDRRRPCAWAAPLLAATLVVSAACARAQSIGEGSPLDSLDADAESVEHAGERPGMRVGTLELRQKAGLSMAYDSNVLATRADRDERSLAIADWLLQLVSDTRERQLEGDAFVRARRFADASDQDTTEYGLAGLSRHALGAHDELAVRLLGQRRFESRLDIETPNTRAVSFYDEWRASADYEHSFNRVRLGAGLSGRGVRYDGPGQAFRNANLYQAEARGAYEVSPDFALTATSFYTDDDYRHRSALVVSAHTVGALIGSRFSTPELLDFELQAGYFRREFEQGLGGISGISVRGSLTAHPTRLTTIRADIVREDAPTRIVGAYGKIRSDAGIEIAHEYSRSIDLNLHARLLVDQFETVNRTDHTVLVGASWSWRLTRRMTLSALYDYSTRDSASFDESFSRHVTSVSLQGYF